MLEKVREFLEALNIHWIDYLAYNPWKNVYEKASEQYFDYNPYALLLSIDDDAEVDEMAPRFDKIIEIDGQEADTVFLYVTRKRFAILEVKDFNDGGLEVIEDYSKEWKAFLNNCGNDYEIFNEQVKKSLNGTENFYDFC